MNYFEKLVKKVSTFTERGIDIINLGRGNPDQPTPSHIVQALKQAIDLPENQGYPPFHGKKQVREAISTFYKREYQVDIDPETEVFLFNGSTIAIAAMPQAIINPGEYMLTTDPAYPLYYSAATLARANVYAIPVFEKDGFLPDYRTIPKNILEKTKLLLLNYPNNPTGAIATSSFFQDTISFANTYHIPVMHDFAYGAFGFDGHKPVSILQTPGAKEVSIEVYTMSKTYNMAGWRFGFAVGNASLIHALEQFHDHAHSIVFGAVQDAATTALIGPQDSVQKLNQLYETRRNVFVQSLREIGWEVQAPQGSFFAWFKVPNGFTGESFADFLLEHAHVAVAPGEGFGKNGSQYIRVGLLETEQRLKEAARRIQATGIFHTQNV